MFRCRQCNELQETGINPVMVVTEVAIATYPNWTKGRDEKYFETQGTRIIKEVPMCGKCAASHPGPKIVGHDKYSENGWTRIDHKTGFIPKEEYLGNKNVSVADGCESGLVCEECDTGTPSSN